MPESKYDKGYKQLFSKKTYFLHLLQKYLKLEVAENIPLENLQMIDKSFVDPAFRKQESDVIYRLKNDELDIVFYVLLELQSSVDHTMPARLLFYMTELLRRYFRDTMTSKRAQKDFRLPAVVPIVLYNGGEKWSVTKSFKEYTHGGQFFENNIIDFTYILLDLNQTDEKFILSTNNALDYVFLLDKGRDKNTAQKLVMTVFKYTRNMSLEERTDVWEYFFYVLKKSMPASDELKEKLIKGDEKDVEYAIEHAFKTERQEGRQEGRKEGRQEGRKEEKIEIAKKMLHAKAELDFICKMTGLSPSVIDELKKQTEQ